jgi:methyl-accepting chemotaxis protein
MVERLQAGAEHAVSVMGNSQSQARGSVEQAVAADEALNVITSMVSQINEMNTQIASAAEQQSAVAEEINKNINTISEVSERTAQGANDTAAASESMTDLASQLQAVVGRFKL